jgi:hypothetical protein
MAVFSEWMPNVLDALVIQPIAHDNAATGDHWTGKYVTRAYGRGLAQADADLRASGYDVPSDPSDSETVRIREDEDGNETSRETVGGSVLPTGALTQSQGPHGEALRERRLETYLDVRTATDALRTGLERELASSLGSATASNNSAPGTHRLHDLSDGSGGLDGLANRLNETVAGVGERRAGYVAAAATVASHATATIERLYQAGVERVGVDREPQATAEWTTAGDRRVCNRCRTLALGGPYLVADVRSGDVPNIPQHPGCRCKYIIST